MVCYLSRQALSIDHISKFSVLHVIDGHGICDAALGTSLGCDGVLNGWGPQKSFQIGQNPSQQFLNCKDATLSISRRLTPGFTITQCLLKALHIVYKSMWFDRIERPSLVLLIRCPTRAQRSLYEMWCANENVKVGINASLQSLLGVWLYYRKYI